MKKIRKITKEIAIKEVAYINSIKSDDESAHSYEDDLHYRFISCIANGFYDKEEAIEVAKIVKSTSDIAFSRWYA